MKPLSPEHGSTLLAAVAGFVDTLGFVALFGLFTAHVTGNFVLIGAELVQPGRGVALKLLAFPAFVLAVAASRWIGLSCERKGRSALRTLMGLQALLLLAFMGAGLASERGGDHVQSWLYAAGLSGAAAMGIQNGTGRALLARLTPNTVMTGNVTQLVIEATNWLAGLRDAEWRTRFTRLLFPVMAFALGAMSGAVGFSFVGFQALLLPAAAVVWVAGAGIRMADS